MRIGIVCIMHRQLAANLWPREERLQAICVSRQLLAGVTRHARGRLYSRDHTVNSITISIDLRAGQISHGGDVTRRLRAGNCSI